LIPQSAQNLAQKVPGAGVGSSMLGYLSKFVLQMLPTISATVIGAYIVATWINPKTPPEPAKTAARAQAQQPVKPAQPAVKVAPAPETPAQDAAVAPVEAKSAAAAESPMPAKAANGPDNIRIIPIVKPPAAEVSSSTPASVPASEAAAVADDRKDANELARAAIQRLRGGTEAPRAAEEPARPVSPAARVQQVRLTPEPAPASSAPPLPPAVPIAAPRYPQDESAEPASIAQPERLTPPGEIPTARHPLSLQASHPVGENPSLADNFVSATKSFFRAITPP